jgi:uncharacterized delta-60 repeat protein
LAAQAGLSGGCERLENRCLLAAGVLDAGWDIDGRVTTDFGVGNDRGATVVVQSDGRVVIGGMGFNGLNDDFVLARYNSNGSIDTTFGLNGQVATSFGIGDDRMLSLALQQDGKLVAGGKAFNGVNNDFALARYNTDGSLDASFGAGGLVVVNLGTGIGDDQISGLTLQADGRIVVAGATFNGVDSDFVVARFLSNGLLDASFGGDGVVTTDSGRGNDAAYCLVVQPDGRIVVVGATFNNSAEDFGLMRYLSDGSVDTSFGTNGGVATAFGGGADLAYKVALTSSGKIVVVGTTDNGVNFDFAVARYLPNGSLDTSFDSDGKLTLDFASGDDIAFGVAVQPSGQIVVAGSGFNGSVSTFAVARINANGNLDTSFASGGTILAQIGLSPNAVGRAVAIQADGKIVVAGYSFNGTNDDLAVARFDGDGLLRMFRTYNPIANFHFFTTSQAEFTFALAHGYRDETTSRTGFTVAATQLSGSLPIHRMYNPIAGSHYYTTNDVEREILVSLGWRYERDEGFLFTLQVAGTVEVFRLWNKDSGVHLFTESVAVRDAVLAAFPGVWLQHASVGFAYPVAGLGEAQAAARLAASRSAVAVASPVFAFGASSISAASTAGRALDDIGARLDPRLTNAHHDSSSIVTSSRADFRSRSEGADGLTAMSGTFASPTESPRDWDQVWVEFGQTDTLWDGLTEAP